MSSYSASHACLINRAAPSTFAVHDCVPYIGVDCRPVCVCVALDGDWSMAVARGGRNFVL